MRTITDPRKAQKWKAFSIAVKEEAFETILDYYTENSKDTNLSFSRFIGKIIIDEIAKRKTNLL
mgnify:CR=1 FL=1